MTNKLSFKEGLSLSLSSVAPFYSVFVTAPLIVELVGAGTPIVFIIALIPILLVCFSMSANDIREPSKGTIYFWALPNKFNAWVGGLSLAITGIIATAGQAYVAVEVFFQDKTILEKFLIGISFIVIAGLIDLKSIKLTSIFQWLGLIIQGIALIIMSYLLIKHHNELNLNSSNGNFLNYAQAVLLAVFAYWGFDSVFALSEESDKKVPYSSAFVSLLILLLSFLIMSFALSTTIFSNVILEQNLWIKFALFASSFMSLGSTLIPTARGLNSMADNKDIPEKFSSPNFSIIMVIIFSSIWLITTFISKNFFNDSITSLSIFVGLYFAISSFTSYIKENKYKIVHFISFILISIITILTFLNTIPADQGNLQFGKVSGIFIISIGFIIIILISYLIKIFKNKLLEKRM